MLRQVEAGADTAGELKNTRNIPGCVVVVLRWIAQYLFHPFSGPGIGLKLRYFRAHCFRLAICSPGKRTENYLLYAANVHALDERYDKKYENTVGPVHSSDG